MSDHSPRPTRAQLVEFIQSFPDQAGIRHVAKAFKLKGADRAWLREELKSLSGKGLIQKTGKKLRATDRLPPVAVLRVAKLTGDGDLTAIWQEDPTHDGQIFIAPGKQTAEVGARVLARLQRLDNGDYSAKILKVLEEEQEKLLVGKVRDGKVTAVEGRSRGGNRALYLDAKVDDGALIRFRALPGGKAEWVETLGDAAGVAGASLIALAQQDIQTEFPAAAVKEAEAGDAPELSKREDLRQIPLVTIDGADARDFDDAVYAEAKDNGGHRLLVAIADVAHYVKPGGALDSEAQRRGNSVYLPDRVVPMLPEVLSNGWCSLNPDVERACLAVWMDIDAEGRLQSFRFVRGLMKSAARLTYEQVEDHRTGEKPVPALGPQISALYAAFDCLLAARKKRGTLELDIPEYQVRLNAERTTVIDCSARQRLESHKLIEEFMILANVAAATQLENKKARLLYRSHRPPETGKIELLNQTLKALALPSVKGGDQPKHFANVLRASHDHPAANLVSDSILRSQCQAMYTPDNDGHFGLALQRYAHFTSPIRRYADLIVHRALIGALELPGHKTDALDDRTAGRLSDIGTHISGTERAAAHAERAAKERLLAEFLSEQVGAQFDADIVSVTRHGLFVSLTETGAQGLLPFARLPDDYYTVDEDHHQVVGKRGVFSLGDKIRVELIEAQPEVARLAFGYVDHLSEMLPPAFKGARREGGRRTAGNSTGRSGAGSRSSRHKSGPGKTAPRKKSSGKGGSNRSGKSGGKSGGSRHR